MIIGKYRKVTIWLHVEISTSFWLQLGYNLVTTWLQKKFKKNEEKCYILIYYMTYFLKKY